MHEVLFNRLGGLSLPRKSVVRLTDRPDMTLDGWMDDLRFYVLFNSISVISGRWADDNERLCAMEPRLRLKRSSPQAGLELTTARSVGQRLTH